MQPLAHLIVSLTLAAGCATAVAADRAAEPGKISSEVQVRQAAIDAAAREKEVVVPAAPVVTKADRAANRKLLAAVRRAVVRDKTLSMAAHNVKMAANAGVITLTGDVRNAAEKSKTEAIARNVVGVSSVDSQLTLKTVATGTPTRPAKPAKAAPAVRENTRADARTRTEKTR